MSELSPLTPVLESMKMEEEAIFYRNRSDELQKDLNDARNGWESAVEHGLELEKQRDELLAALKQAQSLITRMHAVVNDNRVVEFLPHGFYQDVVNADIGNDGYGIFSVVRKIEAK